MPEPVNIVFVGAGNVSTHLSKALQKAGNRITQVITRTVRSAKTLASILDCDYATDLLKLDANCDLIIISVGDKQINDVLAILNAKNKLILHTSGSLPMNILSKSSNNYGVFYPLQTFTKNSEVDFADIPFIIEANSESNLGILQRLASSISDDVRIIGSEQRKIIHLAAVIVNNFTNLNYSVAESILAENDLPFDILKPLIMETAKKVMTEKPSEIQTGPAFREDDETISNHLEMLSSNPDYFEIYDVMSRAIASQKKRNEKL